MITWLGGGLRKWCMGSMLEGQHPNYLGSFFDLSLSLSPGYL